MKSATSRVVERDSFGTAVEEVSRVVSEMAGIQLGDKQAPMVENRLKTRMLRLGLEDVSEYLNYLNKNKESESQALLSLMTTHHTYFFREFTHFEFLLNKGLDAILAGVRARGDNTLRVWSAACSRGQEAYSLAMFLNFHVSRSMPNVKIDILGTDVDPESVSIANNGVYRTDELKQSPAMYVEGCWVRGTGNVANFSKARKNIKDACRFSTYNLLSGTVLPQDKKFDLIFCRNVFIYFNEAQIKEVSQKLLSKLEPHGYLMLGVSESLNGLGLPVQSLGASIYQHQQARALSPAPGPKISPAVSTPKVAQVLCVDDSPTILALLKRILTPDKGFQVKATASNGKQALDILAREKFDAITLDLHMPEMDGVSFLRNYNKKGTPVIVLSSINRDDPSIAREAISLGASDYVEKPSLENLSRAGEEIRSKLKSVLMTPGTSLSNLTAASAAATPVTSAPALKKVKVMIVDDSATIRKLLAEVLKKDPQFEVVAEVEKPSEVESLIIKNRPDVITLDIHMPEMDGVTLLKKIHPKYKIPTVMISSISREEGPQVLQALENGAVDYIQKPGMNELSEAATIIRERLKIAAAANTQSSRRSSRRAIVPTELDLSSLILMGASTGGTEALRLVLEGLPAKIPPILIVQHIPPVFSAAFAKRLNDLCPFEVREAVDGDLVKPGLVLIAPGGKQMEVHARGRDLMVAVTDAPPMNRHKPSVDHLFQSATRLKWNSPMVSVILTGMGADGARQMKVLRGLGARTIAQDQATSVVYGMPREAAAVGAAEFVEPLDQVASRILELCASKKDKN